MSSNEVFWDWSVAVYGQPGVAAACLALQDEDGLDVNVLLLCLWSGLAGRGRMGRRVMGAALDAVRPWQRGVITPLRAIRRQLKATLTAVDEERQSRLRERIQAVELDAERVAQEVLADVVAVASDADMQSGTGASVAAANLASYAALAGSRVTPALRGRLARLLATVGTISDVEASAALDPLFDPGPA